LSRVRLPKLEIHQSDVLDIEKFNYLLLLLIGTAATEIGGLPTTAANFEAVMHILKRSKWASGLSDLQVRLPRGLMRKLRSTSVALGLNFNSRAEESRSSIRQATWRCQATDGFALDILCCIGFIDKVLHVHCVYSLRRGLPQFKSKVHQPEDSTGGILPIKSLLRDTFFYYLFDDCMMPRSNMHINK
ncbi:hypothetical protein T01_8935, partial [Trichinella spiralis]